MLYSQIKKIIRIGICLLGIAIAVILFIDDNLTTPEVSLFIGKLLLMVSVIVLISCFDFDVKNKKQDF